MLRSLGELGGTGQTGGGQGRRGRVVRFYKSQCKSRDKYYLLFEERHSRYLLYRGKCPVLSGTQVRAHSKKEKKKTKKPVERSDGAVLDRWGSTMLKDRTDTRSSQMTHNQRKPLRNWGHQRCHFSVFFFPAFKRPKTHLRRQIRSTRKLSTDYLSLWGCSE